MQLPDPAAVAFAQRYLEYVMRPPSCTIRVLRSLIGLVTVWCLGCSAYDPLIAALVPATGGRMMVCASEDPSPTAVDVLSGDSRMMSIGAPASDQDRPGDATCGCDSCHAPAVAGLAVVSLAPVAAYQPSADPGVPPSVPRAPAVPPPQNVA